MSEFVAGHPAALQRTGHRRWRVVVSLGLGEAFGNGQRLSAWLGASSRVASSPSHLHLASRPASRKALKTASPYCRASTKGSTRARATATLARCATEAVPSRSASSKEASAARKPRLQRLDRRQ